MADSAKEEGEISDEEEATGILPENSHLATSHLYSKQTDNHGYSDANLSVPEYISPSQIGRINRKKHKVGTIRFLSQNTNNSEKTIVTKLPSPQKNTHLTSHALNKKQDFATLARNDIWNDQNVQQSPSSRLWDKRRLRSSKGDDISSNKREEDFQALLEKYKKIQDQLANIRQEEEAEVNGEQVESQVRAVPEADEENTAELRDGKKANGSQLEENLILLQTSSGTAIDGDKNGITEPEQTDDQDVLQTSTCQISTTEDDDNDLDELKLRRIALASAAEKIMRAELSEFPSMEVQDSVPEMEALPAESQSHAENKVSLPTQQDQTSKSGRSDQRKHPSRYSSSQRKDAKPYRPLRYRAPSVRPSRLHTARRNDSSHRDSSSRRTSSESHHRKEDSRRREADRQYTESERQRRPREPERKTEQNTGVGQTREIQRILTLDDPEEQVSRFLALINRKGADKGSTSSKSPLASLSLSESHLNVRGDDAVGAIPASKDNYNVEEMDIDSDPDSPAISTAMEELQFEPDIYSAMMPMYTGDVTAPFDLGVSWWQIPGQVLVPPPAVPHQPPPPGVFPDTTTYSSAMPFITSQQAPAMSRSNSSISMNLKLPPLPPPPPSNPPPPPPPPEEPLDPPLPSSPPPQPPPEELPPLPPSQRQVTVVKHGVDNANMGSDTKISLFNNNTATSSHTSLTHSNSQVQSISVRLHNDAMQSSVQISQNVQPSVTSGHYATYQNPPGFESKYPAHQVSTDGSVSRPEAVQYGHKQASPEQSSVGDASAIYSAVSSVVSSKLSLLESAIFAPEASHSVKPAQRPVTSTEPVTVPQISPSTHRKVEIAVETAMPAYMPDISPRTRTVTGDRVVSVVPNYQPEIPSSTPKPSNRPVEANTYPYEPEITTNTQRVVKSIEPSVSTYAPKSSHISGHAEYLAPDEYVSTPTNVTTVTPMEYAPIVTEYIPVPTKYVPAPNEHVPVPMEYVPAATGHVMDTSEYAPNTSEYVPDTSEYVPDMTEYVPDPPEYVPSGLASIPVSTEEYIPSPIVKQTSDGEDEEAILRAQLLRSLKRREMEKAEEQARSESPGSRSHSPSMYNSKPRKYQPQQSFRQKIHIGNLPIHKPVVINLGDDSSDEDDDYLHPAPPGVDGTFGGVDAGLKAEAAYDSSGTEGTNHSIKDYQGTTETQMRKQALKALEKQYENDCLKQSESILKDQALLKTLVSRASKYLQSLKVSEDTVDKLREQLAAAERVATAYTHQLDTMKKQANLVKNRLLKKKSNFTNLQKSLLTTGKELHGASYRPPSLVDIASKGKRQVQSSAAPVSVHIGKRNAMNFKVTIDNLSPRPSTPPRSNAPSPRLSLTPVKVGVVSTPATPPRLMQLKSDEEKVREKERLQKLAEDVESKLRQLRQSQMDIQERRGSRDPLQGPPGDGRSMKEIPRLDKIDLSTVTIDLTDDIDRPSKRRRSLMELNPSMKPDVKVKDMRRRTISDSTMEKKVSIKIPEGKALLRVLKLQRQNIAEELMSHGQNNNSILAASQGFDSLLPKVEQVAGLQAYKGPMQGRVTQQTLSSSSGVYRSPLLHFRSYRFSPYYRMKANKTLMSNSYAHKLLPKVVLCKFDLQGTCNDDKCRGQHMSGYSLSEREVLLDILSYSCGLAGVTNTTPAKQVPGILGDYVDNMLKQNQGRLCIDDLCLLLLSHVTDRAKHVHPHTMFYNPRSFRPKQDDKFAQPTNQLKEKQKSSFEWQQPRPTPYSQENVIGEQDVRYFFHADSTDIQDLESAVTTSPHDIHLWFKLASKKLNNPNLSREESLDHALNVLARGVEENKQNSDIWYRYLSLYSRHGAAVDFMDLCQTALQLAPSFHIWWLYLHSLATYTDRREVCGEIVDYLCLTQDKSHPNTAISHHLLEAMLYGANLSVAAGNVQYAANVLQCYFVKSEGKAPAQSSLTTSDRCVLWLAYIHLRSCGRLPGQLFDPADQMSGCIMCKETLIFPWHELSSPEFTISQQLSLLQEAVNVCITSQLTTNPAAHKDGLVLYQNIIQLLLSQNRLDDMLTMCRDLLQKDQTLVDIWLSVANVYSASSEKRATQQVFADAEEGNPHTAKVFYYAAQYEILQNETDKAIECLENCPLVYFDSNLNDSVRNDPLSFYCILLNQSLPLGYDPPPYRSDITTETIQAQQTYLWLNFCLFLELQGNLSQAVETYETALSSLSRAKDITLVWLGYLEYQYRQLRGSPQNAFESRKLTALLHRCLVTMPTKFEMPYWSDRLWTDYSYVDRVVDWYLKCLLPEQRTVALDRLLNMMPTSLPLVLRCCEESLRQGDNQRALSICYPPAYDATKNPSFWKLVTSLAIKQGSQKEVRRLFHKAVQTLPYSVSIWRDFLTFELTQGARSVDVIEAIVTQCQRLGVNMDKLLEGFPEISLPS